MRVCVKRKRALRIDAAMRRRETGNVYKRWLTDGELEAMEEKRTYPIKPGDVLVFSIHVLPS